MQRREVTESVKKKKINKFALPLGVGMQPVHLFHLYHPPMEDRQKIVACQLFRSRHIDTFLLKSVQSFARSTKNKFILVPFDLDQSGSGRSMKLYRTISCICGVKCGDFSLFLLSPVVILRH